MNYTVVVPEQLIHKMGNTSVFVFEKQQDAVDFARAASKATGNAVEVQRNPTPYKIRIMFLEVGGNDNV